MTFAVDKSWAAVFAQRQMGRSSSSLGRPFRRLVSDAQAHEETEGDSGYSFLSEMNVRIRELNQVLRHANDGISLAQLAGDGLREMESALKQIQTLLDPHGVLRDGRVDLNGIQLKIQGLIEEVDRIVRETQMGDAGLSDATHQQGIQVGKGDSMPVVIANMRVDTGVSGGVGGVKGIARRVEKAVADVSNIRSDISDVLNKFELAVLNMDTMAENMAAARVRPEDLSAGNRVTRQVRNTVFQEASTAIQAQANHPAQEVLTLLS
ncbi:MAG: hypothetical protein HQL64_16865 [Magnetococcales bacterium]|nr:hypothetical protein [Magnetococcales bacterium]